MESKKRVGIWMDHSTAHLIDLSHNKDRTVTSSFSDDVKEEALKKSEKLMHNKEQQMHEAYYKELADVISNYDYVLLFGPTDAKLELHNYLNKDSHFKDIKVVVEPADKMSENEKAAFVKKYFIENPV